MALFYISLTFSFYKKMLRVLWHILLVYGKHAGKRKYRKVMTETNDSLYMKRNNRSGEYATLALSTRSCSFNMQQNDWVTMEGLFPFVMVLCHLETKPMKIGIQLILQVPFMGLGIHKENKEFYLIL